MYILLLMKDIVIIKPDRNFRGLPYSHWAERWWNWLLGTDPDHYRGGTLFLRGNVDYKPVEGVSGAPPYLDESTFYDRSGKKGITLFEGTPIFFPVLNALMISGDLYDGKLLKTADDLLWAARRDIEEGGKMWATVRMSQDRRPRTIVNNLKDYLIESSFFQLTVSEKNRLRNKLESPLKAGTYRCITVGYYLLLILSSPDTYRIHFGGRGRGTYYTEALYDITFVRKSR